MGKRKPARIPKFRYNTGTFCKLDSPPLFHFPGTCCCRAPFSSYPWTRIVDNLALVAESAAYYAPPPARPRASPMLPMCERPGMDAALALCSRRAFLRHTLSSKEMALFQVFKLFPKHRCLVWLVREGGFSISGKSSSVF